MSRKQRHGDLTESKFDHLWLVSIWHMGLLTCHRWGLYPATSKPTATEEASQWRENAYWRMRLSFLRMPLIEANKHYRIMQMKVQHLLLMISLRRMTWSAFCKTPSHYSPKTISLVSCFTILPRMLQFLRAFLSLPLRATTRRLLSTRVLLEQANSSVHM